MFYRHATRYLEGWKESTSRKPLVIRGARQIGKTTTVELLGAQYIHYISYNLELLQDQAPFELATSIDDLVGRILLPRNLQTQDLAETLLFIDEIQASSKAMNWLRYFYEAYPQLHVIATGSLLEHAISTGMTIPVGRVEYMVMHPMNFSEYLMALGLTQLSKALHETPISTSSHDALMDHFVTYMMLGGMPEVLHNYVHDPKDYSALEKTYNSLIQGYLDDIEKYARNPTDRKVLRHLVSNIPNQIHQRIKFQKFGNSTYRSREVGEAFRSLEMARLVDIIYPTTTTTLPASLNTRKRPKLHFLDTGLALHMLGIRPHISQLEKLSADIRGSMMEQIIVQEISSIASSTLYKNKFWVRDKDDADAEVDLVYQHEHLLIPIEIKSGSAGKLRSLHQYMDRADHHYAVRFYKGPFEVHDATTIAGKKFKLMNMPAYLGTRLKEYLEWFVGEY